MIKKNCTALLSSTLNDSDIGKEDAKNTPSHTQKYGLTAKIPAYSMLMLKNPHRRTVTSLRMVANMR